jgi:hypothetical protein
MSTKKFTPLKQVTPARGNRYYACLKGHRHPSVTAKLSAIAKPALLNWYAKVEREMVIEAAADLYLDAPETKMSRPAFVTSLTTRLGKTKAAKKELDKASDIGSQAHAWIEYELRKLVGFTVGAAPVISDPAMWAVMAWEDWRKTVNLKPLWIEQAVVSEDNDYAGTIDLIAEMDLRDKYKDYGRATVIVDWKTGKAIYGESRLQISAYAHAYKEMGHSEIVPPGLIVRLPKVQTDPEFETQIVHEDEQADLFNVFLSVSSLWGWQQAEEAKRTQKAAEPEAVTA